MQLGGIDNNTIKAYSIITNEIKFLPKLQRKFLERQGKKIMQQCSGSHYNHFFNNWLPFWASINEIFTYQKLHLENHS